MADGQNQIPSQEVWQGLLSWKCQAQYSFEQQQVAASTGFDEHSAGKKANNKR